MFINHDFLVDMEEYLRKSCGIAMSDKLFLMHML